MTKDEALKWLCWEFTACKASDKRYAASVNQGMLWLISTYIQQLAIFMRSEAHERGDWVACLGYQHIIRTAQEGATGTSVEKVLAASDMITADVRWRPVIDVMQSISFPSHTFNADDLPF